jgi:hypothetical protein
MRRQAHVSAEHCQTAVKAGGLGRVARCGWHRIPCLELE